MDRPITPSHAPSPMPTLFVSHGSPMHALHAGRAGAAWAALAGRLPRPRAALMVSAHWETQLPMVTAGEHPETIHDFGGFPPELERLQYPAPGAPALARSVVQALRDAGLEAAPNACRGLDHGAWVPLLRMYPHADVPVLQLSIQPTLGAEHHLRLGAAIAPLARDGVLIVGSGHMTHNLGEWIGHVRRHGFVPDSGGTPAAPYAVAFADWVAARLTAGDRDALAHWESLAPHARRAHPTTEHFLPLLVAYGAAGPGATAERIDAGIDAGVLSMDAYLFGTA